MSDCQGITNLIDVPADALRIALSDTARLEEYLVKGFTMDDERLKQSRTAWRKPSIISPLLVTEQRKAWPTPAGRRAYFLSRIEYLFSIAISLDAASGIFAPLPRICLLVQRWP